MPSLLRDHADGLTEAILAAEGVLLCTDFDGTLVPLDDDPGSCTLGEPTRTALAALHAPPRMHVAVVSGRRLDDVRDRVGIDGITYAGNHGLEIEGPGMVFREPAAVACRDILRTLADDLEVFLAGIDGARLELKGLSLTVHVRQVRTECASAVRAVVARAVGRSAGASQLQIRGGKGVIEVRPNVDWNKGHAVAWLAGRLGCAPTRWIFIGDDETDEDAFVACRQGITIRVGDPDTPTAARYVATAADIHRFLVLAAMRMGDRSMRPEPVAARGRIPCGDECRGR